MNFDRIAQWVANRIWGYGEVTDSHTKVTYEEPRAHFHSQNLNEDRHGNVKGWAYHGRCWLRTPAETIRFEWHLWRFSLGAYFTYDPSEDGWAWHIAFPPFSLFLSASGPRWFMERFRNSEFLKRYNNKYGGYENSHRYTRFEFFNVSFHDWTLFWTFLKFDWGWSRQMPKWMSGSFHPLDFFLGSQKFSKELISTHEVMIPMPEGQYPATVKIERCTWKRPRWFAKTREDSTIDIPWGIPHQGKGENSWDCGEDRLYGCGSRSTRLSEVIGDVVKSALRGREKYDHGGVKAVYPPPSAPPPREPEPMPVAG